jgi:heme/copper-type cytochrome/quinol oxidase subunit 3
MHDTHASTPTALLAIEAVPSGKLGIWWFLSSEIITFGGLLGSYLVFRLAHPEWAEAADHLSVLVATGNTLVLLTSSLTMVLAFAAADHQQRQAVPKWLGMTVVCGLLFLFIKALEWSGKISHGLVPSASGFWSFYYAMTGLHALHVLGGVVVNALLWLAALRGRQPTQSLVRRIEVAGLYWHFVDIVWIFLFPLLYLS